MKIQNIKIRNSGYVCCKSSFYSAHDILNETTENEFLPGINRLIGEIDSGNWGISYLIGMYPYDFKQMQLFLPPIALVNNQELSLRELAAFSCYLDKVYPLFSTKETVKSLVLKGIKKTGISVSPESICDIFHMDIQRFERPLSGVGNEIFRAMAAIGFCHGKEIYCFPWLSKKRFDGYHGHMTDLLNILESLGKIVILPVGE